MPKRRTLLTGLALSLLLAGCSAGSLYTVIDDLTGGGNDSDFARAVVDLSHAWQINRYSGDLVGAVDVPSGSNLVWTFESDFTFTVTSAQPVTIGGSDTLRYAESGRWRITDARNRGLGLTLTRHAGVEIPVAQQAEVSGVWFLESGQLVVTTSAIGPGTVRYVGSR
ncbi:MAG: hypothetical protein IT204_18355 [Fimbriimonadaceae bacterium]|nr:hypothetical protein [Fimbriimonadaceae bacterium]